MIELYRRFRALDPTDRRLIVEAAVLMSAVRLTLAVISFPRLQRLLDRYVRSALRADSEAISITSSEVGRIAWAISASAERLPVSMSCFVRALTADAMLRHRGLASKIRIGVREANCPDFSLEAHAWVECNGQVVIGSMTNLIDYAVLSARSQP